MVKIVQSQVASGGRQQTQVRVWGMVCLLLGTAVPFSCYLWAREETDNISEDQTMTQIIKWLDDGGQLVHTALLFLFVALFITVTARGEKMTHINIYYEKSLKVWLVDNMEL